MNIVVIGSCADSSHLAKELNKRLNSSIIARVDLLKDIKQLILPDLNVRTNENIGTYIGDVEIYDYTKITAETKKKVSTAFESINTNLKDFTKNTSGQSHVVSTFDALTNGLPTGTYSFIKIYSGAIDNTRVLGMVQDNNFLVNTIFIKVKAPKNALLPISVSQNILDQMKTSAFAFVECEDITDFFKSEICQLLFELNGENKIAATEVKTEPAVTLTEVMIDDFLDEVEADEMAMVA